jgi:CMP-N-acetylneuraminic acid synthetase
MSISKNSVTAFIFARGGSKGIPDKNISLLCGKPLIAYSIDSALNSSYVDKVIVSTDSEKIAQVAREYGAEVPFIRPANLAVDNSSEWLAWQNALDYMNNNGQMTEIFLSVPATAPLRLPRDLDACVDKLVDGSFDIVVTGKNTTRSPYFNMLKLDGNNAAIAIVADKPIVRRQDAPVLYDMTTVAYAAKSSFIQSHSGIFDGSVGLVVIPEERAIDIDTYFDFKIAELLIKDKSL